jgi:Ca2+-binding RTX toxin-like protein
LYGIYKYSDILHGLAGNDTLYGQAGNDTLDGENDATHNYGSWAA